MSESYSKKSIRIDIALDDKGSREVKTFEGFAVSVSVQKNGDPEKPKATVTLLGLSLDTMAQLTRLAFEPLSARKNLIEILAGEQGKTLASIFKGEITTAWADFNKAPSVEFQIEARSASYPSLIPQSPLSVKGQQTAEEAIKSLCNQIGYSFENAGVTASISDCVINGDPVQKMRWIANTVGANLVIDDNSVVLMPKDGVRKNRGEIPLIRADNGMIGYPTFDENGVSAACFFRPDIRIGGRVKIESVVPRATGVWKVTSLTHELAAYNPGGGSWKTSFKGSYIKNGGQ